MKLSPSQRIASDLQKGDRIELKSGVSIRIALVQRIIAIEAADLLPEDCRKFCPRQELLQIEIFTERGIMSKAFPGTRINYWTIWRYPNEVVQLAR